jgi:hypothetical protein
MVLSIVPDNYIGKLFPVTPVVSGYIKVLSEIVNTIVLLLVVCRRAHVLLMLFVFVGV